jgi:hypothetical protein
MSRLLELESRFDTLTLLISGTETYAPFIHVHGLECQPDVAGLYYLDGFYFSDDTPRYRKMFPNDETGYVFFYEPSPFAPALYAERSWEKSLEICYYDRQLYRCIYA